MMERNYYDVFCQSEFFGWEMCGSYCSLQRAKEYCDFLANEEGVTCRVYKKTFINGIEKKYDFVHESTPVFA